MMARDASCLLGGVAAVSVLSITERLDDARALLLKPEKPERSLPALGAALLAAVTALLLAGAVILGPGTAAPSQPRAASTT